MKIIRFLRNCLILLLILILICFLIPRPKSVSSNSFIIDKKDRPLLIAHGGGNKEFPDNTLEAFYHAYSIDPNCMMETDVSITKDGVIILSHDRTLDRKTNVSGAIIDWNYSDLVEMQVNFNYENPTSGDNGFKINDELVPYVNYLNQEVSPQDVEYPNGVSLRDPEKFLVTTLEDLIVSFPNNTINVEIKQTEETGLAALHATLDLMVRLDDEYHTFDRIVLASFHKNVYDQILEYQKEYPTLKFSPNRDGITMLYAEHWVGVDFLYNEPVTVLQIPMKDGKFPLNTSFFINAAHRHNIAVHYWTINKEEDMRSLIEKGADGIMSDIPSLLKKVLDEMYGEGYSPDLIP